MLPVLPPFHLARIPALRRPTRDLKAEHFFLLTRELAVPDVGLGRRVETHVSEFDDAWGPGGVRECEWVERFCSVEAVYGKRARMGGVEEGWRRCGGGSEVVWEGEANFAGAHSPVDCAELDDGRDLDAEKEKNAY